MTWNLKVLAASALFLPMIAPASAGAETIGVSMSQFDDNFLTVLRSGMAKHAATLPGVSLQMEDAQNDIGKQLVRNGERNRDCCRDTISWPRQPLCLTALTLHR
jgi:ABC-type sugar transport system substrate-binding protein